MPKPLAGGTTSPPRATGCRRLCDGCLCDLPKRPLTYPDRAPSAYAPLSSRLVARSVPTPNSGQSPIPLAALTSHAERLLSHAMRRTSPRAALLNPREPPTHPRAALLHLREPLTHLRAALLHLLEPLTHLRAELAQCVKCARTCGFHVPTPRYQQNHPYQSQPPPRPPPPAPSVFLSSPLRLPLRSKAHVPLRVSAFKRPVCSPDAVWRADTATPSSPSVVSPTSPADSLPSQTHPPRSGRDSPRSTPHRETRRETHT